MEQPFERGITCSVGSIDHEATTSISGGSSHLGEGGGIIWDNQIKVDIPAAPGSSGAGIFDVNGNLIAEFHGVLGYRGTFIEGGGLAINGQFIREWLTWTGWSFICN